MALRLVPVVADPPRRPRGGPRQARDALALHHQADELGIRRYGVAALAIVLLHAVAIAAAGVWYQRPGPVGTSPQPILIDLAPASVAQQLQTEDLAPGPVVQQAEAPPPEPIKQAVVEEQLPPTPTQPETIVAAPPKVEPKVEPVREKQPPVRDQTKKPIKKETREQLTTARADRVGPEQQSPTAGASAAAAAASYRATLVAHLQRFKRWPPGAEARGESGMAYVNFVVSRSGAVSGIRLTKSAGYASLDQEATAWIQRAAPMPSFPADVRESSMPITAPLHWVPQR